MALGITQVTDDVFKKYDLNWGKDGILYVSTESQIASSEKIFIINPDGTGKRRLIENGFNQRNPMWSRDGNTILYEATDIPGNKLIELLNLQKPEVISTVSPVVPTVTRTITPTVTPAATGTPVIEKTPEKSSLWQPVLSVVLILGLIVIIILAISNFMSKKK